MDQLISIDINPAQIREVEATFAGIENAAKKVLTRAINKTLTGARTDMVNEAAVVLNMTKTEIRAAVMTNRASWNKITGKVWRTGSPIPLSKFRGTRQTQKGVSVKIKNDGARTILKHAFIATMNSGHVGVFWRVADEVGAATRKWSAEQIKWFGTLPRYYKKTGMGRYRLQINELTGPRVEDILSDMNVFKKIEDSANARLQKNLDAEINFELSRL